MSASQDGTAVQFVDTNILLYASSKLAAEEAKTAVALKLLDEEALGLSVQVLQEFYVQATRATKPDRISPEQATALIESWQRFAVQDLNVAILKAAIATSRRYRISYWDAAIIESARALGCKEVLSEDLNAGQSYDGVRVVNPFAARRARSSE
jgi:predicted nucleic acid-binding protein